MSRSEEKSPSDLGTDQWSTPDADRDVTPPDGQAWDLLIIGGGTAGIVAAKTAAGLGASVLLVERDRTGGDCLWNGCVPSKALLSAAHAAADAHAAARFGVHVDVVRIDFSQVMEHVRRAIATIEPEDSPAARRRSPRRPRHREPQRARCRDSRRDDRPLPAGAARHRLRAVLAGHPGTGRGPTPHQ